MIKTPYRNLQSMSPEAAELLELDEFSCLLDRVQDFMRKTVGALGFALDELKETGSTRMGLNDKDLEYYTLGELTVDLSHLKNYLEGRTEEVRIKARKNTE
ncbi:MAG: hypothetical protein J5951_08510 [Bacteroidales bacterium]|nr:hypothetical protein [Bacteroidales bacterium]